MVRIDISGNETVRQRRRWPLAVGVALSAVVVASLGITASDKIGDTLGARILTEQNDTRCPQGMVFVSNDLSDFCIDRYEASASEACIYEDPAATTETKVNIDQPDCFPESRGGAMPWRVISQHEAQLACAKAGKHLATNREWYLAALGTPDTAACNIEEGPDGLAVTGAYQECISAAGAYDMVGNAWEWVDAVIVDGVYQGRRLPDAGFVASVDEAGVPLLTLEQPQDTFNEDRFWFSTVGAQGMLRGGYFGGGADAGMYAIYAASPPTFSGGAAGFRCAK